MKPIRSLLFALPLIPAAATASVSVLFSDDFNRSADRNIDADLTGIVNNTGSAMAIDGVYTHAHVDPANIPGPQDGNATNGGGAQVTGTTLQLAVGAGTSNAVVNHNFTNASILANGNFSVAFDITGVNQSTYEQGGGFALGMSYAEAMASKDAWNAGTIENPTGVFAPSMTGAFNGGASIGNPVPGPAGGISSDFWVALRGNGTLVWGGSSGNVMGVTGLAKTGSVSVSFSLADFNAGSTVNYEVFYNSISQGSGSFLWSGTNENFIGLDARDNTAVGFDNLSVTTIPEPSVAALAVLGFAGLFRRRR
ncbi:PEP-CTERM sorting domain-containing protein [Luteolibacter marinus]|uniref:PEP-CTERM sorting domain-containing protein n=1 Tax=Luteolibacter marinus TaxID=2776705 RepID=UPI0018662DD0|nr:MYXO-CTERM sorting domain-containing protein [Luteolibacter marinus]